MTLYYVGFLTDLDAEENQNIIETLRGKVREKLKNAKVMLIYSFLFSNLLFTCNMYHNKLLFVKKEPKSSLNITP